MGCRLGFTSCPSSRLRLSPSPLARLVRRWSSTSRSITASGICLLVDTAASFPKGNNLTFLLGTDAIDDPGATTPTIVGGGEGLGISFLLNTPASNQASLTALVVDGGASSRSAGVIGPFLGNDLLFIAGRIDWAANGSNDTLTVYSIADPTAALPAPFGLGLPLRPASTSRTRQEVDWDWGSLN
jgi:hypothetical protein